MTLQKLLDRLKGFLQSKRPETAGRGQATQRTAQEARDQRTSSVTTLQREVRQLQQEITDLSARQDSSAAGGGDAPANEARMETLQADLARKQADLAKYQARV